MDFIDDHQPYLGVCYNVLKQRPETQPFSVVAQSFLTMSAEYLTLQEVAINAAMTTKVQTMHDRRCTLSPPPHTLLSLSISWAVNQSSFG